MHAEHDDSDVGIALDDLRGCVDAVKLGHGDIHYYDVWRKLLRHADSFPAIGCLTHHFDGGIGLQQESQTLANNAMVVDNEDLGDWHGTGQRHLHLSDVRAEYCMEVA